MLNGVRIIIHTSLLAFIILSFTMLLSIQGVPFKSGETFVGKLSDVAQSSISLASVNASGKVEMNMSFIYVKPVGTYRIVFNLTGLKCYSSSIKITGLGFGSFEYYNTTNIDFVVRTKYPIIAVSINTIVEGPCSISEEPMVYFNIEPVVNIRG